MASSQLAATCLFGLEQEMHFSTIYTADLRNKLITAAKLHSHTVRLTSVTPGGDQGRGGARGLVRLRSLTPWPLLPCPLGLQERGNKAHKSPLLECQLQPRRGLPASALCLELLPAPCFGFLTCTVEVWSCRAQGTVIWSK